MKWYLSAMLALTLAWAPLGHAQKAPTQPPAVRQEAAPDEAALDRHGHYVNQDGQTVHAPAKSVTGAVPAGASATCRDGTYSFSKNHRGTCSHHGGVATWL